MIVEVAVESVEQSIIAEQSGATRLELCANLDQGGTTPSFGMIREVIAAVDIPVHVMIRPRAGNFTYSDRELHIMQHDIIKSAHLGVTGIVFGVLNDQLQLDTDVTGVLVRIAKDHNLVTTFHRAIDVCSNHEHSIQSLIDFNVDWILTSGQQPKAIDGINVLKDITEKFSGQIRIMAGSGVNASNVGGIIRTGIDAVHFTCRKKAESNSNDQFDFGPRWLFDDHKMTEIMKRINS